MMPIHTTLAPGRGRAWWTVALLSILYIVSYVDRLVLGLLVEPIKADLSITDTQMALLIGTSFAMAYSVLSVPMGGIADRSNRKRLILIGGMIWTLSTAASAFAPDFKTLLILRVGVAVGEAVLSPAALSMIADMFPRDRRALPTSVYGMSGAAGATGAYVVAAAVLAWVSGMGAGFSDLSAWRLTLLAVGLPGAVFVLLLGLTVREPPRSDVALVPDQLPAREKLIERLRIDWRFYVGMIGGVALMAVVNMGTLVWYPTHLIRTFGFTAAEAGLWFGICATGAAVVGTFGILLGANRWLKRRTSDAPVRVALLCVAVGVPCILVGFLTSSPVISIIAIVLGESAMIGMANLPTLSIQLVTPNRLRGQFIAIFFLAANVLGLGLGPPIVTEIGGMLLGSTEGASLGTAQAIVSAIVAPIAFALLLLARRGFRTAYDRMIHLEGRNDTHGDASHA